MHDIASVIPNGASQQCMFNAIDNGVTFWNWERINPVIKINLKLIWCDFPCSFHVRILWDFLKWIWWLGMDVEAYGRFMRVEEKKVIYPKAIKNLSDSFLVFTNQELLETNEEVLNNTVLVHLTAKRHYSFYLLFWCKAAWQELL